MITTEFLPGSPCWLDLGTPDLRKSTAFYSEVFDWTTEPFGGQEPGGYTVCRRDGKVAAAIGPAAEEGAPAAWTVYFHTPDAEETVRAVREAGGEVRVPPSPVGGDNGWHAQLTDPQGGRFAVWQPGAAPGLEVADVPGSLEWTELFTTDTAAARQFYGKVFGWHTQEIPLPGGGESTYTLVTPRGAGQERMQGGIMQLPAQALSGTGGAAYWHPVFGSADCDATVTAVTARGGAVRMGPEDAEGVGRLAVCTDPEGAEFVVLTPEGSQG
ncbi:VOC family protein [Streptomyces sp. NPDC014733]|uniref:VOC family protein n=1 Tax=Streptomyces sp. NPDC014733 TaxID=3364885 RepID=UPI0036FB9C6B